MTRTIKAIRGRMSRARTATVHGSSGFALVPKPSKIDVKSTQSPEGSRGGSRSKCPTELDVASQLGESNIPRKRRGWHWAKKQLHRGFPVSRHGFCLELHPKRTRLYLQTFREIETLVEVKEGGLFEVAILRWTDLNAYDWYVPEQLELIK